MLSRPVACRRLLAPLTGLVLAGALLAPVGPANAATAQPVSAASMPDPGVILNAGTFYAFSTGSGLQESTASLAAGPWSTPVDVLQRTDAAGNSLIPAWMNASQGIWAPDLIDTDRGWVVYFSAVLNPAAGTPVVGDTPDPGARCIGSAVSTRPTGPFVVDAQPVVCLPGYGASDPMANDPGNRVRGAGVIDASPSYLTVSGERRLYLLYKTQEGPATIRMARLSPADGRSVFGDSHQLLVAPGTAQSDTIEAPSLIQRGTWYVLFVAHGNFDTCDYETRWYASQHIWSWPTGSSGIGNPLLNKGSSGLCGPGGADVTDSQVAGQNRLFFHGWIDPSTNLPARDANSVRRMYAAVLTWGSDGYTPIIPSFL
jgi:arabinan endo-1,5-alpha-L-arabinosidase